MFRILELSSLRLEVLKFKASLGHIMRYCLKRQTDGVREDVELIGLLGSTKDSFEVIRPHNDN